VPPATYWDKIQKVLNKYDILLVADEVICGFGRTGKMFGCETYGIKPDAIVVSKQITSSYFPLSAIILNDACSSRSRTRATRSACSATALPRAAIPSARRSRWRI